MRAAFLHGFGDLRLQEAPDPTPGPDEVVLRVDAVQPSVTEAMLIAGAPITLHDHLARRMAQGPVAFGGHEFGGTVAQVGPGVDGSLVGLRATAVETIACGACSSCRRGERTWCSAPTYLGFTRPGAFAEYVVVPAEALVPAPAGVSLAAVTALQPLAGALHAHAAAAVAPGESVLVIGAGVMGLLAVQVARRGDAGLVACLGRSAHKRALATSLGADVVLDAASPDAVAAAVAELTDGRGVDVVIETAGGTPMAGLAGADTLRQAAQLVRRGGRIVLVSVLDEGAPFPVTTLREKAVDVLHPRSGAGGYAVGGRVFDHAMRLVARGDVDVESLITATLTGLDELPTALAMSLNKGAHGLVNPPQVVLHPWDAPTTAVRPEGTAAPGVDAMGLGPASSGSDMDEKGHRHG